MLYVGTGHRMEKYPWAEKWAFDGVCTNCDNANLPRKPVDPQEAAEEKARIDAKIDKAAAILSAKWEKTRAEINAIRAANGFPPFPSYADD